LDNIAQPIDEARTTLADRLATVTVGGRRTRGRGYPDADVRGCVRAGRLVQKLRHRQADVVRILFRRAAGQLAKNVAATRSLGSEKRYVLLQLRPLLAAAFQLLRHEGDRRQGRSQLVRGGRRQTV